MARVNIMLAFSNFDDQLLLWVDGKLVVVRRQHCLRRNAKCSAIAAAFCPQTSDKDLGDFAPAGIGARDAKLAVSRLASLARYVLHRGRLGANATGRVR